MFREVTATALLVAGALFPIVNPLGNAPVFLTLTRGLSEQGLARLAWSIAVNSLVLLLVSILLARTYLGSLAFRFP